ncbi:MAG: MFS transporter [Solirubrobacteraceae bacterium]
MRTVLRTPGVLPLFGASLVARLPMGALGLLLILHTQALTGSYARGGLAAGVYALALGISNPALARVVDRSGQTLVLRAGAPVSAAAIAAVALLPASAPTGLIVVFAAIAGAAQPPIGSCMRALWPTLVDGPDARHIAYSLESVALETVYICGPVVIVAGIGSLSVPAALLVCAATQILGDLAFSMHPVSRSWTPSARGPERDLSGALRAGGVRVLVGVFALSGLAVGAVEVAVPASLDAMGHRELTGVLLGVWGVGSLLAGVAVSRLGAAPDGPRRLAVLLALWGATHAAVAIAGAPVTLALTLLLAGASIAPTFIVANSMLDGLAPVGTLTEAFTWTSTGMVAGVAVGSTVAGALVDAVSPAAAMGALGCGGLLAALLVRGAAAGSLRAPSAVAA